MRGMATAMILLLFIGSCHSITITGKIPLPSGKENYPEVNSHSLLNIPKGQLPPPGSCRIWFPGRLPGHQPPSGICSELVKRVPLGAWLLVRPTHEPKHVNVHVYDQECSGIVVAIHKFEVKTGRFIKDLTM